MQPLELSLCKSVTSLAGLALQHHVMEPKLDGIRIQLAIGDGRIQCWTRSNHDASGKMVAAEAALGDYLDALDGTVLDGEAVYIDESGAADFNFTARCMGSGKDVCVQKQRTAKQYVSFVVFDILALRGTDVRHMPLAERRTLIETLVAKVDSDHVRITEQAAPTAEQHRIFTEQYGEGSVIKDVRSPYTAGRSKASLKWKKTLDEDVVVMGSEEGKGKFRGMVGAVVFGQYRDGVLVERGRCSGMTDAVREELTANLPVGAVMVVTHNGVLAGGGFRHPQFSHFRSDKLAEQCEWTVA
jgi:ATP-dependent DNA ligase